MVLGRLREQVARAVAGGQPGQGEVERFGFGGGGGDFQLRFALGQASLDALAQSVHLLTDFAFQVGRSGLEPVVLDVGEQALLTALPTVAQFFPRGDIGGGGQLGAEGFTQRSEERADRLGGVDAEGAELLAGFIGNVGHGESKRQFTREAEKGKARGGGGAPVRG